MSATAVDKAAEAKAKLGPEAKFILGEFCRIQREKYGPDWKRKLAEEMSAKTTPIIQALLAGHRRLR